MRITKETIEAYMKENHITEKHIPGKCSICGDRVPMFYEDGKGVCYGCAVEISGT